MLRRSPYKHRFLYAGIAALALVLSSAIIMLSTFVWVKDKSPILTPSAIISFTPVPTNPSATPVEKVFTDTQYIDEHIQIKITKVSKTNLVYYVADVKMDSVQYFKNSFAKDDQYRMHVYEAPSVQAKRHNAILAINSDDCGYTEKKLTIRNGILYNDNFSDEVVILKQNGELQISKGVSGTDLVAQGTLHSYSFGPTLVLNGQYVERSSKVATNNPRTGIGMIEPLHYIFIVVDGRNSGYSIGLKMADFAQLFVDYGCTVAYNLDGGGSSAMYFNGKIINKPDDGDHDGIERKVSDIIYIGLE